MVIDNKILDSLTEQAKENPRLRQAMDLRNSPEDGSQRMLNALEPGTVMPIHRPHTHHPKLWLSFVVRYVGYSMMNKAMRRNK